jgi:DNA recombination protein RmuC
MMLVYGLLVLIVVLLCLCVFLLLRSKSGADNEAVTAALKAEFSALRMEQGAAQAQQRTELSGQLQATGQGLARKLDEHEKELRREQQDYQGLLKQELNLALRDYKERMQEHFSGFGLQQERQHAAAQEQLGNLKQALETAIAKMQQGNEQKLDEMRRTVDEKLHNTLEQRLGESFKLVSERLEAVHKGLGDMQHLALSVGDLKKVMNNVKTRGILGEYQLQQLVEDLLTQDQYGRNVKTKPGSGALVEFAVKMPNGSPEERTLWLPIDSKFPREDYEALLTAYDAGLPDQVEDARKAFARAIRKNAQDIRDKYIEPPYTTEYGIMFLPFESLYAEALRIPGLLEQLHRDYKITITGPTTLSALLNSLQMGFRTLAIERRSGEVWDLLSAVKTEFGKFGDVLAKTKKKLIEATHVIEDSETRSRSIERKLRNVQELPPETAGDTAGLMSGSDA